MSNDANAKNRATAAGQAAVSTAQGKVFIYHIEVRIQERRDVRSSTNPRRKSQVLTIAKQGGSSVDKISVKPVEVRHARANAIYRHPKASNKKDNVSAIIEIRAVGKWVDVLGMLDAAVAAFEK